MLRPVLLLQQQQWRPLHHQHLLLRWLLCLRLLLPHSQGMQLNACCSRPSACRSALPGMLLPLVPCQIQPCQLSLQQAQHVGAAGTDALQAPGREGI